MIHPVTPDDIKALLHLKPHPVEGGWFVQTWCSEEMIPREALAPRYPAPRHSGTAIYYLLEPNSFFEMHCLASDEVFHFYLGDPVEMLQLDSRNGGRRIVLGSDLAAGQHVQTVVPHGVWQGSRLVPGGSFALLGCTVSPGFDYADYDSGQRAGLTRQWPEWGDLIEKLTRHQGTRQPCSG